jgi:hypothetical protein
MRIIIITISLLYSLTGQSNNAIITMYKDEIALIKQPVSWTLESDQNTITWDLLPVGIIKDSPFLSLDNARVKLQRLNQDVFRFSDRLFDFLGQTIDVELINGKSMSGKLIEVNDKTITLQRRRSVISFNRERIDYINASGLMENIVYKPSLTWNVSYENRRNRIEGDLIYLSKGFDWDAIYRLILDESGNEANFLAEAYIINNSNLNFNNISLQLVEGKLKKNGYSNVPPIMMRAAPQQDTGFSEDQLGDYHIYQLNESINLLARESITTRLYPSKTISFEKTYLFENDERRQKEEPLAIEYQIANTNENNLGVPLPKGKIQLFQTSKNGTIEFVGEDEILQVPKGETATIISGRAFDVIGKRVVLNYNRQKKSEETSISIIVTNILPQKIKVRLIEHIFGDWVIRDASANYRKEDASTIHFPITIPANGSQTVTYTYRKEWK